MKVGTNYKSDVKWLSHECRRSYIALLGGEVIKQIILLTGQEKGTDLDTILPNQHLHRYVLNLKTCSRVSCSTTFLVWQIQSLQEYLAVAGVLTCWNSRGSKLQPKLGHLG
jgi:hypothetical protein